MDGELVSTRDVEGKRISYTDALLQGLAPDGGLYVPTQYPQLSLDELVALKGIPYTDLAFVVKKKFTGSTIPDAELQRLIRSAYTPEKFDDTDGNIVPVIPIGNNLYVQNLSLGPTAAFKDMALQLLGQEMNYVLSRRDLLLLLLGATSGDTGSSAEAAFKGLDRVKLFMLSPYGKMSPFQTAQMGVLSGGNIYNISVDGVFDDCQDLVKELKKDPEFAGLGAVNSINWGRISSQVPYFVSGYLQAAKNIGDEVDFVVPTGNFGNVLSGYIAKQMGVPIGRLIVATNENNVLEKLINTGVYEFTKAVKTSSFSMDISKASNYERPAFDIFGRDPKILKEYMSVFEKTGRVDFKDFGMGPEVFPALGFYAGSSTHKDRVATIKKVYADAQLLIDTHTADAVTVAKRFGAREGVPLVSMATAMPVKVEDAIREAIGSVPERQERFKGLEKRVVEDSFYRIPASQELLKAYIRQNS